MGSGNGVILERAGHVSRRRSPAVIAVTDGALIAYRGLSCARPCDDSRGHRSGADLTMISFTYYLSMVAAASVAVVLVLGLRSMLRGTSPNTSQLLMRWRIGLQFVAIVVIMLFVLLTRGT